MTTLNTSAINALLTTISHCARETTGFSTGVRGDLNAGTAETRRNLSRHDTFVFISVTAADSQLIGGPLVLSEIGLDVGDAPRYVYVFELPGGPKVMGDEVETGDPPLGLPLMLL